MKIVTRYFCTLCGVMADHYSSQDTCAHCNSNCWIAEDVICSCLTIGPTHFSQLVFKISHDHCKLCGFNTPASH